MPLHYSAIPESMEDTARITPPARLTLFGFEPTAAEVEVVPRARAWRLRGSLLILLATIVAAPLAALIPPHLPWGIGALAVGAFLARRRWSERFTLASLRARCPGCGAEPEVDVPIALDSPHTVSCGECRRDLVLRTELP